MEDFDSEETVSDEREQSPATEINTRLEGEEKTDSEDFYSDIDFEDFHSNGPEGEENTDSEDFDSEETITDRESSPSSQINTSSEGEENRELRDFDLDEPILDLEPSLSKWSRGRREPRFR